MTTIDEIPGSPATGLALSAPPTACADAVRARNSAASRAKSVFTMYPSPMKPTPILLVGGLAGLLLMHPVSASTSAAGAASADEQSPPTYAADAASAGRQAVQRPQYPDLPSETPTSFEAVTDSFDYIKRDVMIP